MNMFKYVLDAAAGALRVPLMPAPARHTVPSAVYRYFPGESDGALTSARFEVRIFARTPAECAEELERLRRAIVADGDAGVIGDEADPLIVCETKEGSGSGFVRGGELYFVKAGFDIKGRA